MTSLLSSITVESFRAQTLLLPENHHHDSVGKYTYTYLRVKERTTANNMFIETLFQKEIKEKKEGSSFVSLSETHHQD